MSATTDADIVAARERGDALALSEPRAAAARYEAASGRVVVDLTNGCTFAFPARALQGLGEARDIFDSRIAQPALDTAYVGGIKSRPFGELFLREFFLFALAADVQPQRREDSIAFRHD